MTYIIILDTFRLLMRKSKNLKMGDMTGCQVAEFLSEMYTYMVILDMGNNFKIK